MRQQHPVFTVFSLLLHVQQQAPFNPIRRQADASDVHVEDVGYLKTATPACQSVADVKVAVDC